MVLYTYRNGSQSWLEDMEVENAMRQDYQSEIDELKEFLNQTDYKLLKYIDGEYTAEEYEEVKQQRHNARVRIKELEELLLSINTQ